MNTAFIVMAYIVMACIVMAGIVSAYVIMVGIVLYRYGRYRYGWYSYGRSKYGIYRYGLFMPTACLLRGYGRAGAQNDRVGDKKERSNPWRAAHAPRVFRRACACLTRFSFVCVRACSAGIALVPLSRYNNGGTVYETKEDPTTKRPAIYSKNATLNRPTP